MQYRRFGRTNLNLSVFSLGTMRYLASEENAIQTVREAVGRGINHIETARGYGNSELFLGAALRAGLGISRDRLYLTTKIPPTPDAASMTQSIDESLERLGTEYLDHLALHGLNTPQHLEWVKASNGCMAAVRRAIEAGKVRHVGFSTHGTLELIRAAIETGFFDFVNLHYYLLFQRHAPAVELAHQRDLGVFIISPADKGGQLYTPPEALRRLCHPFSPLELNYRFLLSDPRITTLSFGPANPEELNDSLQAGDRTHPLTEEERAILHRLDTCQNDVLGVDRCHQCYQCLPCPEDIHIPEVLRLRNLTVAYNMTTFGKYRYRMFENAGHWFPGKKAHRCTDCGDCLPRCPENLEIPKLLRDTHERLYVGEGRRLWG
ncbi:MAG: aldo/keto reductase [Cyanobacteria bacterium SID2]|nr:aldo/keto reductase [Cyanobacteria bacterium SID2]MBP0005569.1 aldo/keto reductase [Cyanobacteria bacterium SBC]